MMKLSGYKDLRLGVMNGSILILLILMAVIADNNICQAMTPEEKGRQIAIESDLRDKGWQSGIGRIKMVMKNRHGEVSTRLMRSQGLEQEGDGDKILLIFEEPRDIRNTAFLSHTHIARPDEQWLYLPALKRIKRIASNNKSGPFMGSEFAYEDIISQEVDNYKYRYLRDEEFNGLECFVVERYPVDPTSSYSRHVVWFDKEEYLMRKNELYDKYKNDLFKTLSFNRYRKLSGKYWRVDELHMVNHKTGKETYFIWTEHKLRQGLTDRDFDLNSLKISR